MSASISWCATRTAHRLGEVHDLAGCEQEAGAVLHEQPERARDWNPSLAFDVLVTHIRTPGSRVVRQTKLLIVNRHPYRPKGSAL